jgi:hypothetical protein
VAYWPRCPEASRADKGDRDQQATFDKGSGDAKERPHCRRISPPVLGLLGNKLLILHRVMQVKAQADLKATQVPADASGYEPKLPESLKLPEGMTWQIDTWHRHHLPPGENLLEAWNGNSSHDVDRIGRGSIHIPNLCITILGGIQPDKLRACMIHWRSLR